MTRTPSIKTKEKRITSPLSKATVHHTQQTAMLTKITEH